MKLIQTILHIGTNHTNDEQLRAQTILLNKIALFTLFTISLYMAMHFFFGNSWIAVAFDGVYITTALLILYFQGKGDYRKACLIVGAGFTTSFACSSLLIGAQNQVEYLIFISTLGTALLFDDKLTRRIFFVFGFVTFALLKVFHIYYPKGLLATDFSPLFSIINGLIVFGTIYFIVDKALIDSKIFLKEVIQKNEEITELNATLEQKVEERTVEIQEKSMALAKSNEELKSFSYIAAHDMREPIRNIIGFSQLLNKDILRKKYDKIEEYGGYIDWAARRINTITKDVVNFSNLDNLIEQYSTNDLNKIVYAIIKDNFSKRHDVLFEIDNLPTLNINTDLVTILFNQLIDNAIQYCDKPQPKVIIKCEEKANYYQFCINDNGVGISKEFHTKIFGMFKRLHNDYQKQGSGIGLSICKKIVESYGGKIWVESEFTKGATFFFTLKK
ncbi:MAG: ATP-binding protein [Saprospiraceae bacterium]